MSIIRGKASKKIRKAHRYLGLFLGIQFLFWTISGLYFSWTDLDEIHGDHFKKVLVKKEYKNLLSPSEINFGNGIKSLELREIVDTPYYWINENKLINAYNGVVKDSITKQEAIIISSNNILDEYKISDIEIIFEVGNHHEYREKPLPAYVISYDGSDKLKSYISIKDGQFQTVRHRSWRWFDFLWMTHTMDYEGRDNFNTITLRAFSLLGLITVLSGFTLAFVTTPKLMKFFKKS